MTIFAIPCITVLLWMQFSLKFHVHCWIRQASRHDIAQLSRKRIRSTTPIWSNRFSTANYRNGSKTSKFSTSTDESEISKLPRLYVGKVPLQPVTVSDISELASANTSITWIPPLQNNSIVPLSDDQAHYVRTVLRMFRKSASKSPQIRVFANGEEWLADLTPDPPAVFCRKPVGSLVQRYEQQPPPIQCWLGIAPPKNKDRVRWMIEKTTELDCTGYILMDTEYSEDTTDDYQKKKFPKLQAYCVEAAEQCERLNLPHFVSIVASETELLHRDIPSITKLNDLLQAWSEQINNGVTLLVCRERSNTKSVWDVLDKVYERNENTVEDATKAVVFLIGPEGGWSGREQAAFDALEHKFPHCIYNVALSRTILRTETAVMTAMSAFAIHQNRRRISVNNNNNNNRTNKTLEGESP